MAVFILVSVTPFSQLLNTLQRLRIPNIFITMFEITYRYIGVLLTEAHTMSVAYSLRSSGGKGIKIRDTGSFAGQFLIRSFDRAGRIYHAMKCRGYSPDNNFGRIFQNNPHYYRKPVIEDIVFFIIVSMLCITFRFINLSTLLAIRLFSDRVLSGIRELLL